LRNLKRVALVFLQSAPPDFDPAEFEQRLAAIPMVVGAHHTHTWTLDGEVHVFSTHLVMRRESSREAVLAAKRQVHELLRPQHFQHIAIEVELEGETCSDAFG